MGNKHPLVKSVNHVVQTAASVFAASILSFTGITTCAILGSVFLNEKANAIIDEEAYYLNMTTSEYVNIDVQPGPNGSIAIGASTVNVTSTTPSGYGLYISGSNTLYKDGDTNNSESNKKIVSTSGTFLTPVSLISNSTTPATWGYAVAGLGDFDDSYSTTTPSQDAKFAAIPAINSEQLIKTNNSMASNETTTIYYGINANTNLDNGEYISGAVSYYSVTDISSLVDGELEVSPAFVTPGQENTITITTSLSTTADPGTVDVAVGSLSCTEKTITSTTPLTISCTLPDTITWGHHNVEVNVSKFGKNYSSNKTLHALSAMQNLDETIASQMASEQQYQLYDLRDNKIYFVSKLADGNIWMTQNLDFEIPTTGVALSPETTRIAAETTLTSTAWGTADNGIYYLDGGDVAYKPGSDNSAADTSVSLSNAAVDSEDWHYNVGSYYSTGAAFAGDTYASSGNNICPKGWRVSQLQGQYSYEILLNLYGIMNTSGTGTTDADMRKAPLYYVRGGQVQNGTITGLGTQGSYMTTSTGAAYVDGQSFQVIFPITFNNNVVSSREYARRPYGHSLRCVAEPTEQYTLTFKSNASGLPRVEKEGDFTTYIKTWGGETITEMPYVSYFTRVGYKQIGWSEDPLATTPTYQNKYEITHFTEDMTLYAVWEMEPIYQAYYDAGVQTTEDGYYAMQDMTAEICAAVSAPADKYEEITSRLLDVRDQKLYYVSKLLDGNCWMTQNLDFELSKNGTTLSPETSAVVAEKTIQLDEWGSGANGITYADGGDKSPTINSSLGLNATNYVMSSYIWHYHIGSYYSYAAATAGSGIDLISQNAPESVCPKGWRLPTGNNFTANKSFGKLMDTYGYTNGANGGNGSNLRYSPLYFQIGGYATSDTNTVYYGGTGFYWSASSYSAPHAFYMSFGTGSNSLAPVHSNERYVAGNVRCVQGSTKQFTIHYDANGGDSAPADTVKYVLTDDATTNMNLATELPTYGQSTFLGWATTANAITPEYAAGATFTASAEQTLYAVWNQFDVAYNNAGKTKNADGYFSMQDMTPEICAAVPTPATAEDDVPISSLIDVRDGFVYFVAKLMDGKCWMTQNLYYQIHLAANKSLSPLTTDVRLPKQIVINNSWNNAYQLGEYSRATFIYDGNGAQQNGIPAVGNKQRHHVYGTIYSYSAAAAGLTESDVNAGNTVDSLCPRGWRMPMGGSNGVTGSQEDSEMGVLFNNYGVIHNRALEEGETLTHTMSPLHLTQAGQRIANQFVNVGAEAVYWQNGVGVVTEDDGEGGTVDKIYASSVFISNELDTLGKTIAYNGGYLRCVASADTPAVITFTADDDITGEFIGNNIAVETAVVPVGTTYTIDGDTITFSNGAVVKAQGKYRYGYSNTFVSWEAENTGTITGDTDFLAHFNARLLFRGITTMQEMTPEICAEAWENDSIRPIDTRDNERYWITKLADGRCWMTEDLDFAIKSAEDGGTTLYPETSNVTEERNIGWTTGVGNINGYRRETSVNADTGNITRLVNNLDGYGYGSANASSLAFDSYRWHYRLGAFYGYNIATAGTGSSLAWGSDTNATESICPKGWHLPTAHSDTQEVDNLISSNTFSAETGYTYQSPTYFYRSGYMASGQSGVTDRGNYGNRWTANVDYNIYTYNGMGLDRNRTTVYNWNLGIRCIADAE